MLALGIAQEIALTVVYTDRAGTGADIERRIISARKSNRRERQTYRKATSSKQTSGAGPGGPCSAAADI